MKDSIKKQLQLIADTAKQKVREYIVKGAFLSIIFVLYLLQDQIAILSIGILTKPIISWQTSEVIFALLYFLIITIFIILLTKQLTSRKSINLYKSTSNIELTTPTPIEIYNAIDNQPPLLRQTFASNYIGLNIRWCGIYDYIQIIEQNKVSIGIYQENRRFYFNSSLDDFPIFKTLQPDSAYIYVEGVIESCEHAIELKDTKIISIQSINKK